MITVDDLKDSVPKHHKSKITPELCKKLNRMVDDPIMGEAYAKNLVTYTTVLQEGRFKLTDYFNAVLFVSFKMKGLSNLQAYSKVFPDKCKKIAKKPTRDFRLIVDGDPGEECRLSMSPYPDI